MPITRRNAILTGLSSMSGFTVSRAGSQTSSNPVLGGVSLSDLREHPDLRCSSGNLNYQAESFHIADYDLWCLPGVPFYLRGPRCHFNPAIPRIAHLGAAQVFGTFCKFPYATLLGEMLSADTLNLGRGGAGPGFYLRNPRCLQYVNDCSVCVVQVMSARSSALNTYMSTTSGLASVKLRKGRNAGETVLGHLAFKQLYDELPKKEFIMMLEETLANYMQQYRELAAAITVPKVLLYVGRRAPLPLDSFDAAYDKGKKEIIGSHPHMVSEQLMSQLSALFDATVVVHTDEGSSRRLINRFNGDPVSIKRREDYSVKTHGAYISPYLHVKAAAELFDQLKEIV